MSTLNDAAVAAVIAENAKLRRLIEILHDTTCPADAERYPQHGEEVCQIFWMDPNRQNQYWYSEVCKALGLPFVETHVSEWHLKTDLLFAPEHGFHGA